jgi:hypothetical protein
MSNREEILQPVDRQIAEVESQLTDATDDAHREERAALLDELRTTRIRLASGRSSAGSKSAAYVVSFWAFWLSFAVMALPVIIPLDRWLLPYLVLPALAIVFVSGFTFVTIVLTRDVRDWRNNRWRFSVRALIWMITALAIFLGIVSVISRS